MIGAGERELLERFLAEAYRWNRRVNLTTVPLEQAWQRHVEEVDELLGFAPPPPGARLVDIGSGMGVPGIPVAVLRPDLEVTLLEADRRKAGFLVHAAGLLGLRRVRVQAERAEDAARRPGWRESFDTALSRGAAGPAALCELALPLLRVGGELVAHVALAAEASQECRHAAALCGGGEPRMLSPGLLAVTKQAPTPAAYPRRPGTPTRQPLHER